MLIFVREEKIYTRSRQEEHLRKDLNFFDEFGNIMVLPLKREPRRFSIMRLFKRGKK